MGGIECFNEKYELKNNLSQNELQTSSAVELQELLNFNPVFWL